MSTEMTGSPTSTTTLTTETELSLLYRVLSVVIKPLRPRLVKPGKPLPAGSPRLTNHPKSKNKCDVIEHRHERTGIWLYTFKPQNKPITTPAHQILYFAGGGFQSPPSGEHWGLVSNLASQLSSVYTFTIVSIPLAPNSPASTSLPVQEKFLCSVLEDAAKSNQRVSLMGDSSGGNIALSLAFWCVEQFARESSAPISTSMPSQSEPMSKRSPLQNVFVISPAVDHRNTNPQIKSVDVHDPVLGYNLIESVSKAWCSAPPPSPSDGSSATTTTAPSSRSDPRISPLLNTPSVYRLFREQGVRIHGVIGTYDVLAPDAELFRRKCAEFDVPGDWLVWEGQMHCFVLAGVYGMKEGKKGVEWTRSILEKNA